MVRRVADTALAVTLLLIGCVVALSVYNGSFVSGWQRGLSRPSEVSP